jgi:hypothetical protein
LEELGWCRPGAVALGPDNSALTEVEMAGTYSSHAGPERFVIRLPAQVARLEIERAASREATLRQTIKHASGLPRQVLSDVYRQLVLGNFARLEGKAGHAALATLDKRYPDQATLPDFQVKSGVYNGAGTILFNLLQQPEPEATGYRILAGILKRLVDAAVLDEPHLESHPANLRPFALPEEAGTAVRLVEGAVREIRVNAYERNPQARRRCIEHYGARCTICGFDFAQIYGPTMDGFIHVHHLWALAEIGEAYEVDPVRDLQPVCPNCHAVIHSRSPALSLEDVREMIRAARRLGGTGLDGAKG